MGILSLGILPARLSRLLRESVSEVCIQDYVSLGYIYLLGVGVMPDAIYYQKLGVNVLHFTSVLDVLVSPIAFMVKRPVIIALLVVLQFFVRWIQRRIKKNQEIERTK